MAALALFSIVRMRREYFESVSGYSAEGTCLMEAAELGR